MSKPTPESEPMGDCTPKCWEPVKCKECGRRKKPIGRDSMDNGLCSRECKGYRQDPQPGHLWPSEAPKDWPHIVQLIGSEEFEKIYREMAAVLDRALREAYWEGFNEGQCK